MANTKKTFNSTVQQPSITVTQRQVDWTRAAKLTSLILHPFLLAPLSIVIILYFETGNLLSALGWAGLCAAFVVAPALLYLRRKMARRQYTDADVSVREHRYGFYIFGAACMVACFAVLLWLQAPAALISLFGAALVTVIVFAAITRLWMKISIHAGVASGIAVAVAFYSLPVALALFVAALLVTWSRLVLNRHTLAEASLGWLVALVCVSVAMMVLG